MATDPNTVTDPAAPPPAPSPAPPPSPAPAAPPAGVGTPPAAAPTDLPEGFATVADFVKAVNEGTYKPTQLEGDGTKVTTKGTENEAPKTGIDLQVAHTVEQLGPEFGAKAEPFVRELATTGDLSADSITKAAADLGIPKSLVEQYVADRKAEAAAAGDAQVAPVYEQVGGQENWAGFQAWANEALGPSEHAKINEALGLSADGSKVVGEPDATKLADYTAAYMASGRAPAPRDLTAEAASAATVAGETDVFTSAQAQSAAINDPRYRSDPEYRAKVERKVMRSNV